VKLKITVDGKVYEVDVDATEPEQPHPSYIPPTVQSRMPAAAPPPNAPKPPGTEIVADESKVCRSPMSGVVVRVSAQIGQQIKANDVLLVLEAMKMETVVTSPVDGKIAKVNVNAGDPVQNGQVLVEFE
jgi:methylmalonyl-CoA carboxyltransferase 1.3S subunit